MLKRERGRLARGGQGAGGNQHLGNSSRRTMCVCVCAVRSVAVAFRISEFITTIKRNKSDNSNHKLQSRSLCLFRLP